MIILMIAIIFLHFRLTNLSIDFFLYCLSSNYFDDLIEEEVIMMASTLEHSNRILEEGVVAVFSTLLTYFIHIIEQL